MSVPFDPTAPQGPDSRERPKRPDALPIATELWGLVIITQIAALFGQYPVLRDSWDDRVRDLPRDTQEKRDQIEMLSSGGVLIGTLVFMVVALTALTITVMIFTRNGYNPARLVLAAAGFFIAFNLLFALFGSVEPAWVILPMIISGVVAGGASMLLMRRESEQYCRDMAEFRRSSKSPSWPPYGPGGPGLPYTPGSAYSPGSTPQWPYGDPQQSVPPRQPADRPHTEGDDAR